MYFVVNSLFDLLTELCCTFIFIEVTDMFLKLCDFYPYRSILFLVFIGLADGFWQMVSYYSIFPSISLEDIKLLNLFL